MMKYLPFLALCALAFLPTQVESFYFGIILFRIRNFVDNIFYTNRRNKRDCEALLTSAGITNTENCFCDGSSSLYFSCDPLNENTCLSSSGAKYCTNKTYYFGFSTERERLAFTVSPKIQDEYSALTINDGRVEEFFFGFSRDVATDKYVDCFTGVVVADDDFGSIFYGCDRCQICENGLDFTYDCIDYQINGTCIPIASVIASF